MKNETGRAAVMAAGTFLAGFGAMYTFYSVTDHRQDLRGLFTYESATWGDAVLLPIIAASLSLSISGLAAARRERVVASIGGAFGLAVGAASQVGWLIDPNPGLNWTLPRPHQFSAAGWYHAAFLSGASAAFAGASALALTRAIQAPVVPSSVRRSLIAATAATVAFAGLVIYDNAATRSTAASRFTGAAGLAGALGLAILAVASKRRRRKPATEI
jgi:hypothetical protein